MERLEKIRLANEYLQKLRTLELSEDEQKKLVKEMSKKLKLIGPGKKNPKKVWEMVYKQLDVGICVLCGKLYPIEDLEECADCGKWEGYCPSCSSIHRWSLNDYVAQLFMKHGLNVSPDIFPLMMELEVDGFELDEDFIRELCEFAKANSEPVVNERVLRLFLSEKSSKNT